MPDEHMMSYRLFGSAFGIGRGFGIRFRAITRNRAIGIGCRARNRNPIPRAVILARHERLRRELDELARLVAALPANEEDDQGRNGQG